MKIAVFPGSFDPIHIGHVDIVNRMLPLFDKIIIAIGHNDQKHYMFDLEKRMQWINDVFLKEDKIEMQTYKGLTIDFCKSVNAKYIVRGLRTTTDFEFEKAIAQMNRYGAPEIDTVFVIASPENTPVSSTIIRDIIKHGGDVLKFLPAQITHL